MEQRFTMIALATNDIARSRAFYASLGWKPSFEADDVTFYQAGGHVFGTWDAASFTKETGLPGTPGGAVVTYNARTKEEVDEVLQDALDAGARVLDASERDWGGYSGHFIDPDGHVWEIGWNPMWPLDDQGNVSLA